MPEIKSLDSIHKVAKGPLLKQSALFLHGGIRNNIGGHVIDYNSTRLIKFLYDGKLSEAYDHILKSPSSVNDRDVKCNFPAIALAAGVTESSSIIDFMLEKGVEVDSCCLHGNTALRESCLSTDINVTRLLIKKGANINKQNSLGETALYVACQRGNLEIAKLLVANGAKFNERTFSGASNLTGAVSFNQIEVVRWLIENKENVNMQNSKLATPLMIAVQKGYKELVQILIDSEADVTIPMKGGFSPLYSAVQFEQYELCRTLIQAGGLVNQLSDRGFSPLFYAAQKGNLPIFDLLVRYGGNLGYKYKEKYTLADYAKKYNHVHILEYLKDLSKDMIATTLDNGLPIGWSIRKHPDGQIYYINNKTKTIQDTLPIAGAVSSPITSKHRAPLPVTVSAPSITVHQTGF